MGKDRFRSFTVTFKETDLWIGVSGGRGIHRLPEFALERIKDLRLLIEEYGERDVLFFAAMAPYAYQSACSAVIAKMFLYAQKAGVGPMASVAGIFAQEVGEAIRAEFGVDEIIVENGGDLYLNVDRPVTVSVLARASKLSRFCLLDIDPGNSPFGICTSSGTIGHSYSQGCADAVTIACREAGLADAFATAFGNKVHSKDDIDRILEETREIPEILGTLIVVEEQLGIRGNFALAPVPSSL
jgi:ApbE superfamily uncharacterized protein (UPF0280 family)